MLEISLLYVGWSTGHLNLRASIDEYLPESLWHNYLEQIQSLEINASLRLRFNLAKFPALKRLELGTSMVSVDFDGSEKDLEGIAQRCTSDEELKKEAKHKYKRLSTEAAPGDKLTGWVWRAFEDPDRKFKMFHNVIGVFRTNGWATMLRRVSPSPELHIQYDMDTMQTLDRRTQNFNAPTLAFPQRNVGQEDVTSQ